MNKLLNKSDPKLLMCFSYPNEESRNRAQKLLIEIGLHCLKYIDWVEEDLKSYYNDCLDLLYH